MMPPTRLLEAILERGHWPHANGQSGGARRGSDGASTHFSDADRDRSQAQKVE